MVAEETSSENAFETTLTAEMGPTDLAAAVVTKGSLTSPSILTIEPDDDAQREIIRFNGTFGGSSFVTSNVSFRYLPGSAAPSGLTHPSGSIVRSTATAQHFEDLNDRVDALDHGDDLAGLGDDDHTQYHTDARGDVRYVELAGDTMTGLIVLSGDPSAGLNPATKQYVDDRDALYLPLTGGTLSGNLFMGDNSISGIGGLFGPSAATFQLGAVSGQNTDFLRDTGLKAFRIGNNGDFTIYRADRIHIPLN